MKIIIALIGFIGGVLVTGLKHYFSDRRKIAENRRAMRTEAYVGFVAAVANANNQTAPFDQSFYSTLAEYKMRIAMYGSPRVIRLLAEFFENQGVLDKEGMSLFSEILQAMRNDVDNNLIDESTLEKLLKF